MYKRTPLDEVWMLIRQLKSSKDYESSESTRLICDILELLLKEKGLW